MARVRVSRRRMIDFFLFAFFLFASAFCILSALFKLRHTHSDRHPHLKKNATQNDYENGVQNAPTNSTRTGVLLPIQRPRKNAGSLKDDALDSPLQRVCGSPAVDGYKHVDPECLFHSPTNGQWRRSHPNGGKSGEGLDCNKEVGVSIDGLAVQWGINNKKSSPEECCQACRDYVPRDDWGSFSRLPCNAWVYCPDEECFEADAHIHTRGDCWLKFTEAPQSPEINARGFFDPAFRRRHPSAPERCPWISGVLVPPGQTLTNGTWSPRASW